MLLRAGSSVKKDVDSTVHLSRLCIIAGAGFL